MNQPLNPTYRALIKWSVMHKIGSLLLPGVLTIMVYACQLPNNTLVDSNASARVWLDKNADGKKDLEDTPIEGIRVCATTNPKIDQEAEADYCYYSKHNGYVPGKDVVRGMFFPGAKCQDIYIFVVLPEGYKLSTPGRINNCTASFGLVPMEP